MSYADLIDRLEKAETGSRELDWLIAEAFDEIPAHTVREIGWDYNWWRSPGEFSLWRATDSEGRSVELWQPPQRSTSLDAAVALVERVLPGWKWGCHFHNRNPALRRCYVVASSPFRPMPFDGEHATPAIALLIATLKALSQEPSK